MVYLDADIQVFESIDHLFDLPNGHFYAVKDCFCERTWSHTRQYEIGYCQQCPERAPWPEAALGPPPPAYFNAGMFVHEPSLETCDRLIGAVLAAPPTPFAEQDFLNAFFRDAFRPLPPAYNLVFAMLWRHPERVAASEAKVVHYCAAVSRRNQPPPPCDPAAPTVGGKLSCFSAGVRRGRSRGGTRGRRRTWTERTSRRWCGGGGTSTPTRTSTTATTLRQRWMTGSGSPCWRRRRRRGGCTASPPLRRRSCFVCGAGGQRFSSQQGPLQGRMRMGLFFCKFLKKNRTFE